MGAVLDEDFYGCLVLISCDSLIKRKDILRKTPKGAERFVSHGLSHAARMSFSTPEGE